jgi:hypothetical protein
MEPLPNVHDLYMLCERGDVLELQSCMQELLELGSDVS